MTKESKKTQAKHTTRTKRANFATKAAAVHYGNDSGLTEDSVSPEAVEDLVRRFLREGDEAAKAFTALLNAIAYTKDWMVRDSIACYASTEAYRGTTRPATAEMEFYNAAVAEFPLAV